MQTGLSEALRTRADLKEAQAMVSACVHCGFCNATCPTYQLLGDELDGPRGRIYLIKELLAENRFSRRALAHLDRCLSCRGCETTCPSGVTYGRLLDIGRAHAGRLVGRPLHQRLYRKLLQSIVPWPRRVAVLLVAARRVRWLLPRTLSELIPARQAVSAYTPGSHARQVLLLDGCVQAAATPATNAALVRLLDRLGITARAAPEAGCCGALDHHLAEQEAARKHMRAVIDGCAPFLANGVEAILSSASGCGVHLKEYGELLKDDAEYAEGAAAFSALVRDPAEYLAAELGQIGTVDEAPRVAWHVPCSLQHGQKLGGAVETILERLGVTLTPIPESHLCCGSAGSYSLIQPALARRLRARKIANLSSGAPDVILTANVGCQLYLASATELPVMHWVELVERLSRQEPVQ